MSTVTVTWLDGTEEVYPEVTGFERGEHWLSIKYRFEIYHLPLASIRNCKVETT